MSATATMPIRVLIADDHAMVRTGLRAVLEQTPGFAVVGEAASAEEMLERAGRQQPDVVLLDVSLPDLNGLEATERLLGAHPDVRVLMVTMHTAPEYVARARRLGASGYVSKEASADVLLAAIRQVAGGREAWPEVTDDRATRDAELRYGRLTPRQREIFQYVVRGSTNRQIAEGLGISVKTVEVHRAAVTRRLGLPDVASLTRLAVRLGIVPP